jgi:hypothetical protein
MLQEAGGIPEMTHRVLCWVVLGDVTNSAPRLDWQSSDWALLAGVVVFGAAIGIGVGLLRARQAASPRREFLFGFISGLVYGLIYVLLYHNL